MCGEIQNQISIFPTRVQLTHISIISIIIYSLFQGQFLPISCIVFSSFVLLTSRAIIMDMRNVIQILLFGRMAGAISKFYPGSKSKMKKKKKPSSAILPSSSRLEKVKASELQNPAAVMVFLVEARNFAFLLRIRVAFLLGLLTFNWTEPQVQFPSLSHSPSPLKDQTIKQLAPNYHTFHNVSCVRFAFATPLNMKRRCLSRF
jgi:hypothetical protein